jgi:hypothetical protein
VQNHQESAPRRVDPVIEVYKKDVDCSLLREALLLTPRQRFERFERMMASIFELQRAGEKMRKHDS